MVVTVLVPELSRNGLYYKGHKTDRIALMCTRRFGTLWEIYVCWWERHADRKSARICTSLCPNYHSHYIFPTARHGCGRGFTLTCRHKDVRSLTDDPDFSTQQQAPAASLSEDGARSWGPGVTGREKLVTSTTSYSSVPVLPDGQ